MKTDKEQETAWPHLTEDRHYIDHMPHVVEWDKKGDIVHLCRCGKWTTFCRRCESDAFFPLPPTSWTRPSDNIHHRSTMTKRGGWSSDQESTFRPLATRAVSVWSAETESEPDLELSYTLANQGHGTTRSRRRLASRSMCSLRPRLRRSISNMKVHIRKCSF